MIAFCSCNSKEVVKVEVLRDKIPDELLYIPTYTHPKAQKDEDIINAYILLFSYYSDLRGKMSLIKKRQDEFLSEKKE